MNEIDFELNERSAGSWYVLDVAGELDLHTAPQLRESLMAAIDEGRLQVLVNLADVAFMDSTALGVLVAGLKRAREAGGDLALVVPDGPPRKVLTLTGLDRAFTILEEPPAEGS